MADNELPVVMISAAECPTDWLACLSALPARVEHFAGTPVAADVLVVDGVGEALIQRFRDNGNATPAVVCIVAPKDRHAAWAAGADACLTKPVNTDELTSQVRALLRLTKMRRHKSDRVLAVREVNRELQQAYAQLNGDLEIARRLQASFLPYRLPEVGSIRFAVQTRPHGAIGGDCYDAVRLDEKHVGFYLADAMGHGVPAALLTVYLKRAVVGKEIQPGGYRLIPPDEVLTRLNRDLLQLQLAEEPFITMIYGVVNCETGEMSTARAAHPPPVWLPATGQPQAWTVPGTLLGAFEGGYITEKRTLQPGDRLVCVTDGLCPDLPDPASAFDSPLIEAVTNSRHLPLQDFVMEVSGQLTKGKPVTDDATLLVVERI